MTVRHQLDAPGRLIGYARVSTKDQHLHLQRDALKAAGCGLIFKDHGVSGAKACRPGLDKMRGALRTGDTVVVWKLDRLGRSVLHLADLLEHLQSTGIHFCSLTEGINTATPGGKLVYHVFSAVAEFQRTIIIENTIAGMNAARRQGKPIGRPQLLSHEAVLAAHHAITRDGLRKTELAAMLGVSRMTIDRAFQRMGLPG